jgi:hypothetical protein
MMPDSTITIIQDICRLMTDGRTDCSQWRIGATSNVEATLFGDCGVPRDYRWHICRKADSAAEARAIVHGFRNLSCEECPAHDKKGDESAVYVYAYLKAPLMNPLADRQPARL